MCVRKKYIVKLTADEKEQYRILLSLGKERVRELTRARILLKANEGWIDRSIYVALDVSRSTVDLNFPYGTASREIDNILDVIDYNPHH